LAEYEDFLDYFQPNSLGDAIDNGNGTHLTEFAAQTSKHGFGQFVIMNVDILSELETFENEYHAIEVNSYISGNTTLINWEQTTEEPDWDYDPDFNNDIIHTVKGTMTYGIAMKDNLLSITRVWTLKPILNKFDGKAESFTRD